MGLWFFLTVLVVSNMAFKAYKFRITRNQSRSDDNRIHELMKDCLLYTSLALKKALMPRKLITKWA